MKYKITRFVIFLIVLTIIGLGNGCNRTQNPIGTNNNKDLNISQVHTSRLIDQSIANQAKENVIKEEEVSDVKAVNTDKELLVAVKVENFNRFQLKKVEKKVKSDLEKANPNYKILVSTDKKMFWELEKLEQRVQKDNSKMKNLKKDMNKIKRLMKEQT